jgi:hypothetical protein
MVYANLKGKDRIDEFENLFGIHLSLEFGWRVNRLARIFKGSKIAETVDIIP